MSPMLQPKCSQILLRTAIDTSSSRRSFVIVFGEISAALRKSALLIFYRSAASIVCCNWLTAWSLYPPHIYVFVNLPVLTNTVYHIFSLFAIHFRRFLHMSRLFKVGFRDSLRIIFCCKMPCKSFNSFIFQCCRCFRKPLGKHCWHRNFLLIFCTKHRQSGLFDGIGQIIEESDQRPSEETPPDAEGIYSRRCCQIRIIYKPLNWAKCSFPVSFLSSQRFCRTRWEYPAG